jgi:4-hydroxybenzoate polyprenyltransferase
VRLPTPNPRRDRPLPRRPYRDSAILYGVLAVLVLGFALLTGSDLARALVIAAVFFVAATAWSWFRFRQRLAADRGRR